MSEKIFAESAARNAAPILEVLREEFQHSRAVLEIGSGTGQHAVYFAAEMPHLIWQTSDREEHQAAIDAWSSDARLTNLRKPLLLDVLDAAPVADRYDAIFSANTAHIMSLAAVRAMFALVGNTLREAGVFCLYGPFLIDGEFTTPSNRQFDASLRARDPSMGIRDLAYLERLGERHGLHRSALYALPANNMLAVWTRGAT